MASIRIGLEHRGHGFIAVIERGDEIVFLHVYHGSTCADGISTSENVHAIFADLEALADKLIEAKGMTTQEPWSIGDIIRSVG